MKFAVVELRFLGCMILGELISGGILCGEVIPCIRATDTATTQILISSQQSPISNSPIKKWESRKHKDISSINLKGFQNLCSRNFYRIDITEILYVVPGRAIGLSSSYVRIRTADLRNCANAEFPQSSRNFTVRAFLLD
jgi:hypothetical protein